MGHSQPSPPPAYANEHFSNTSFTKDLNCIYKKYKLKSDAAPSLNRHPLLEIFYSSHSEAKTYCQAT